MRAAGFVPVDRKDRSTAKDSFSSALGGLRHGASVLIFPEETRSLDGAVLPFQRGGFLLAIDTLARTMAPIEIPLGILTAFVGTPFFIWLLASVSKEWSAP